MEPISLAIGAIGLGMSIFGGIGASHAAKQASQISQDEATQEQHINDLHMQQMELEGRRQNLQTVRNTQRQRALAINSATNQGAQYGSGLSGGVAQVENQGGFDIQGVTQGLQIGNQINAFNQNITQDKIRMAGVQSTMATDQGFQSLGGALVKAGPIAGQIGQGFGSGLGIGNLFMGGGSPTGYGR